MVAFFDFDALRDKAWILFIIVTCCSRVLGNNYIFQKLQVPSITGFMLIGFLCGPYVFNILDSQKVGELDYVYKIALSFISFSAGAEMHLPEIQPLYKPITTITTSLTIFTLVIGTIFVFLIGRTSLLSWLNDYDDSCTISVSLMMSTILAARSPTSLLAVIRELQAKGPITSLLVAVTVMADIVVLTLFAISVNVSLNVCSGESFDIISFLISIVLIVGSFVLGGMLGKVITYLLSQTYLKNLILPLGFFVYLFCDFVLKTSEKNGKYKIHFDPLLVCIASGFVATNTTLNRHKLVDYLKENSNLVFIPFFTLVGLSIDWPVLVRSLGFAVLVVVVRAICMVLGTVVGGVLADVDLDKSALLWSGLLAQAGVSLGLATVVSTLFDDTFGSDFQSTMIAVILINQIIGPLGAKFLLKLMKEDGKGDDTEEHAWFADSLPPLLRDMECQTFEGYDANKDPKGHLLSNGLMFDDIDNTSLFSRKLSRQFSAQSLAPIDEDHSVQSVESHTKSSGGHHEMEMVPSEDPETGEAGSYNDDKGNYDDDDDDENIHMDPNVRVSSVNLLSR